MRIAHLNTFLQGGAAGAARDLHESLRVAGVNSLFYFDHGTPPDESYRPFFSGQRGLLRRVWRRLRREGLRVWWLEGRPAGLEPFSSNLWLWPAGWREVVAEADIIHLHWIADFVNFSALTASLPAGKPVVWTLHDMHALTGGCHYTLTCERFRRGCGQCPQLNRRRGPDDLSARVWRARRHDLRGLNLHVVADSHWLEAMARSSPVLDAARSFQTIHYGVDCEQFRPQDPRVARQRLGLPVTGQVVVFGADTLYNPRKGFDLLRQAIEAMTPADRPTLLTFGQGDEVNTPGWRHLGRIDRRTLSAVYAASDVFVAPSWAEAFGQTALEASASGRAVIATQPTGLGDIVLDGQTGLLVPVGDAEALRAAIETLLADPDRRQRMGAAARQRALNCFAPQRQIASYLALYNELLGDTVGRHNRS